MAREPPRLPVCATARGRSLRVEAVQPRRIRAGDVNVVGRVTIRPGNRMGPPRQENANRSGPLVRIQGRTACWSVRGRRRRFSTMWLVVAEYGIVAEWSGQRPAGIKGESLAESSASLAHERQTWPFWPAQAPRARRSRAGVCSPARVNIIVVPEAASAASHGRWRSSFRLRK